MKTILRNNKSIQTKKIALFNCLKDIEKGKLEPNEEQNLIVYYKVHFMLNLLRKGWGSIRNWQ